MSERDGYAPGVQCWIAAVHADPAAAARFYAQLFGWETENLMSPEHPGDYIVCRLRGRDVAAVVSYDPGPPPPQPLWSTHVSVESADATASAAVAAGGAVLVAPFDSPGGGRMAVLADPQGAAFAAWQPGERFGAERVNEPGAWAMSSLQTPDREAAAAFYRQLFGWETEELAPGMWLFRLPGWVGGEPTQPVPRDVIAVMTAAGEQAQWGVGFWVDDADRTATAAAALGGRVLTEPHDTPGFRHAALADPGGATFTVSAHS